MSSRRSHPVGSLPWPSSKELILDVGPAAWPLTCSTGPLDVVTVVVGLFAGMVEDGTRDGARVEFDPAVPDVVGVESVWLVPC